MKMISFFLILFIFWFSNSSHAWGVRGHFSICKAATSLVQHKKLSEWLKEERNYLAYICDIPDLQWRLMSQNFKEHRLNPENLGYSLSALPLDYKSIMAQFPGQFKALGSNWWRAEQFYRRLTDLRPPFLPVDLPSQFIMNMGFMGHFISDISQPFHSTADYDGYASGHGGIHLYYEEFLVDFIEGNLTSKIIETAHEALENDSFDKSFLYKTSVLEKIKTLSLHVEHDKKTILELDPLITPSTLKDEKGLSFPARRKWAFLAAPLFEPLILKEMAQAALLLASLMDSAYEDLGQPNFSEQSPPTFPLIFNFIAPDYF